MVMELIIILWEILKMFFNIFVWLFPFIKTINNLRTEMICAFLGIPTIVFTFISFVKFIIKIYSKKS